MRSDTYGTTVPADVHPVMDDVTGVDPWVSDLNSGGAFSECQSTVGFDDHPCDVTPQWYVEIEIREYAVANPRWEGKLCNSCLGGWFEWAAQEPDAILVLSVNPIVTGD